MASDQPAERPTASLRFYLEHLLGHDSTQDKRTVRERETILESSAAALGEVVRDGVPRLELPHEATHRRYEPPFRVLVTQDAAGYTKLADSYGLHYVKLLGGMLVATSTATLAFNQGKGAAGDPAMTGAMPLAANAGFVLPIADPANPWLWTASDLTLGLTTTGSTVFGWLVCCYSPFDR